MLRAMLKILRDYKPNDLAANDSDARNDSNEYCSGDDNDAYCDAYHDAYCGDGDDNDAQCCNGDDNDNHGECGDGGANSLIVVTIQLIVILPFETGTVFQHALPVYAKNGLSRCCILSVYC